MADLEGGKVVSDDEMFAMIEKTYTYGLKELRGESMGEFLYTLQTFYSILTWSFMTHAVAHSIEDSDAIYDALQTEWATLGLIDGLILSIVTGFWTVDVASASSDRHPESDHCEHLSFGEWDCVDVYGSIAFWCTGFFMVSLILVIM